MAEALPEEWVLGALLDSESPADLLSASGLKAEDFRVIGHAATFRAIASLAERGRPATAQSVFAISDGLPGAMPFEALRLLQASNTLSREAFLSHAEELRRASLLRKISAFYADETKELSAPRPDPKQLAKRLADFSDALVATSEGDETGEADVSEISEEWFAFVSGERKPHLPTGIEILDAEIQGFVPNLNVIGGLPAMGKSALVAEIIMSCLERGLRVGLFGLEDATKWVAKRHIARAMNLPVWAVAATRLHDQKQAELTEVMGRISNLSRNLLVWRRAGIEPSELLQCCKKWVLNKGCQVIFIDHGGEVQHQQRQRDRYDLAVADTYKQLRDFAVNRRVPVVVLCHFNRDTAKLQQGVPTAQSFAETEYIVRQARLALGLWERPGDSRLRCTVLKRTEGAHGATVAIDRDAKFALVRREGGELLNLEEEQRREAEDAKERRSERASKRPGGAFNGFSKGEVNGHRGLVPDSGA